MLSYTTVHGFLRDVPTARLDIFLDVFALIVAQDSKIYNQQNIKIGKTQPFASVLRDESVLPRGSLCPPPPPLYSGARPAGSGQPEVRTRFLDKSFCCPSPYSDHRKLFALYCAGPYTSHRTARARREIERARRNMLREPIQIRRV